MSLRETDNRTRNTLRAFELLISEAMRQQIAWPFLKPVDARTVPDYYQVLFQSAYFTFSYSVSFQKERFSPKN